MKDNTSTYLFMGMAFQAFIAGTLSILHVIQLTAGQQLITACLLAVLALITFKKK